MVSLLSTAISASIWPQKSNQRYSCHSARQLRAVCTIFFSARCRSCSTIQFVYYRNDFSHKNPLLRSQMIWGVPPTGDGEWRKNFSCSRTDLFASDAPRAWARHDRSKPAAATHSKTLAESMCGGRKFPAIHSRVLPHWKVSPIA